MREGMFHCRTRESLATIFIFLCFIYAIVPRVNYGSEGKHEIYWIQTKRTLQVIVVTTLQLGATDVTLTMQPAARKDRDGVN